MVIRDLHSHFVGDPAEEGLGEFVEEDGDLFFAVGDVAEFMVGFFEVNLEDGFPEGDEFGDVDVAVVDGARGFEGADVIFAPGFEALVKLGASLFDFFVD